MFISYFCIMMDTVIGLILSQGNSNSSRKAGDGSRRMVTQNKLQICDGISDHNRSVCVAQREPITDRSAHLYRSLTASLDI